VSAKSPPLVIITTNEERALPDAFVRRCMVLSLVLPEDKAKLLELLVSRGRAHFKGKVSDAVLRHAASQLMDDRKAAKERRLSPPGQAEYLDLVRAVIELEDEDEARLSLLDRITEYAFRKHPEEAPP
jgi:MoxR-like ATPase